MEGIHRELVLAGTATEQVHSVVPFTVCCSGPSFELLDMYALIFDLICECHILL